MMTRWSKSSFKVSQQGGISGSASLICFTHTRISWGNNNDACSTEASSSVAKKSPKPFKTMAISHTSGEKAVSSEVLEPCSFFNMVAKPSFKIDARGAATPGQSATPSKNTILQNSKFSDGEISNPNRKTNFRKGLIESESSKSLTCLKLDFL